MEVGSLVKANNNFDDVRKEWPQYPYPIKDQILTIKTMVKHHKWGINKNTYKFYLLTFEEMETFPLCHRNFDEIQPPMDLSKLMAETETITHTNIEQNGKKETNNRKDREARSFKAHHRGY